MARKAKDGRDKSGAAAPPPMTPKFVMPDLPPEMFSPLGMFVLADLLPVMIAYIDRDERYRFRNKAYRRLVRAAAVANCSGRRCAS